MNPTVSLTTRQDVLPSGQQWKAMQVMASDLLESGFLPAVIDTWQKALAIIAKGSELGIPPMAALNGINVIRGKTSCSAELMLALINRDHGDFAFRFIESTDKVATAEYKRRSWDKPSRASFTMADATAFGLLRPKKDGDKGPDFWHTKPDIMLRARCVSMIARMAFADSIGGMYLPEELGASVKVTDDGMVEVIDVAPTIAAPEAPRQLNPHNADPVTGEITPDDALAATAHMPVTAKLLATLKDLRSQFYTLDDTTVIDIPTEMTRGAARELKATIERMIREFVANQDDGSGAIEGVI